MRKHALFGKFQPMGGVTSRRNASLIKGAQERQGGCAPAGRFAARRQVATGLPRENGLRTLPELAQVPEHRQTFGTRYGV